MKTIKKYLIPAAVFAILIASCSSGSMPQPEPSGSSKQDDTNMAAEPASMERLPTGVLTGDSGDEMIRLFRLDGSLAGEINAPGGPGEGPGEVHIPGSWKGGELPDAIYRAWAPEQALILSDSGEISTLRVTNSFVAMAGAPGQAAFAFSEAIYEDSGIHSYLYAVTPENASTAPSILDLANDPNLIIMDMPMKPVGVTAIAGMPQGVWYTKTAWGIGGADLIFPINRGLYFYDLTSGNNAQAIDPEQNYQGISPDFTFAASKAFDAEGDKALVVHNLQDDTRIRFALHPASDRGAGFAVFSPDNRFAAWMEGEGSLMLDPPTFNARVRIGEIDTGGIVQEIDSAAAAGAAGWDRVSMMHPVGWLDHEQVLVQARSQDWGQVKLLAFNVQTGTLSVFCEGSFAGFTYP